MTSASAEYTQWVEVGSNNCSLFECRRKSIILCSPSPGVKQSENSTFKFLHYPSYKLITFFFNITHKFVRNSVPGEIEFCWKFSLSCMFSLASNLKKFYLSLIALNLRSLDWLIFALGATPSKAMNMSFWGFTFSTMVIM